MVLFGRLTPLVRSFISIPAGVLRRPLPSYLLLSLVASVVWCVAFAGAGWALGANYDGLHQGLRHVDYLGALALLALVVAAVWQWRRVRAEPIR